MSDASGVDIADVERILLELVADQIGKLAAAHPEKSFYGFALDTNVSYGDVHISANTRDALREHCLRLYPAADGGRDIEQEEELLWQFGDWTFRCIERADADWANRWGPIAERIQSLGDALCEEDRDEEWDDWKEEFMRMTCRVLLTLEATGAFSALQRDDDFRVCSADHDEAVERGELRMDRVRDALARARVK